MCHGPTLEPALQTGACEVFLQPGVESIDPPGVYLTKGRQTPFQPGEYKHAKTTIPMKVHTPNFPNHPNMSFHFVKSHVAKVSPRQLLFDTRDTTASSKPTASARFSSYQMVGQAPAQLPQDHEEKDTVGVVSAFVAMSRPECHSRRVSRKDPPVVH